MQRAGEIKLPTLMLYGGADKVASADATDRLAGRFTMSDKVVERMADHYHELVNEPPAVREKVIERIADWLVAHAEAKAA